MKKQFTTLLLTLVLALGVGFALAATEPAPCAPSRPSGTPSASTDCTVPIDTSTTGQVKNGGLGLGSLLASKTLQYSEFYSDVYVGRDKSLAQTGPGNIFIENLKAPASAGYAYICTDSTGKVVMCPVPTAGVCGSADGTTVASAPTSNLCSVGTNSPVTGSGPWTWNCLGTAGGANASCSASLAGSNHGSITIPSANYAIGTPYTYTLPAGVTSVTVEAWGAGGGGGGVVDRGSAFAGSAGQATAAGGGGSGGGYIKYTATGSFGGQIMQISAGAGGTGGGNIAQYAANSPYGTPSNGTDGGATVAWINDSVGGTAYFTARGGKGGTGGYMNQSGNQVQGVAGASVTGVFSYGSTVNGSSCGSGTNATYNSVNGTSNGGTGGTSCVYGQGGTGGTSYYYGGNVPAGKGTDGRLVITW